MRAALFLVGLCCAFALVAGSPSTEVSPALRDVLQQDALVGQTVRNATRAAQGRMLGATLSTDYNYDTATMLFWHSVSAYCTDDAGLQDWTCNSCEKFGAFTLTTIMDDTTNQGYVGWFSQGLPSSPVPGTEVTADEPFVVVSFRGTIPMDLHDWIEDLSFSKLAAFSDAYPDVNVHEGFWGAYQDMKPNMLTGLSQALSDSGARTVLLTGHSLGAAMAELAALDLKLNVYPSGIYFATYTQGTPRPGNPAFADLYTSSIDASFREIHQADIVPHLPPMALGFEHGPTEVWFDEAMDSYQVCSGTNGEDPSCSDSLTLPVSITDHITYRGVTVGLMCGSSSADFAAIQMPQPRPAGGQTLPRIVLTEV